MGIHGSSAELIGVRRAGERRPGNNPPNPLQWRVGEVFTLANRSMRAGLEAPLDVTHKQGRCLQHSDEFLFDLLRRGQTRPVVGDQGFFIGKNLRK
jgi:hypothetical protein